MWKKKTLKNIQINHINTKEYHWQELLVVSEMKSSLPRGYPGKPRKHDTKKHKYMYFFETSFIILP